SDDGAGRDPDGADCERSIRVLGSIGSKLCQTPASASQTTIGRCAGMVPLSRWGPEFVFRTTPDNRSETEFACRTAPDNRPPGPVRLPNGSAEPTGARFRVPNGSAEPTGPRICVPNGSG